MEQVKSNLRIQTSKMNDISIEISKEEILGLPIQLYAIYQP